MNMGLSQPVKKASTGSCSRGRGPSNCNRIRRLGRRGGEFPHSVRKHFLSSRRKRSPQASFFDGLRQTRMNMGLPFLFSPDEPVGMAVR